MSKNVYVTTMYIVVLVLHKWLIVVLRQCKKMCSNLKGVLLFASKLNRKLYKQINFKYCL